MNHIIQQLRHTTPFFRIINRNYSKQRIMYVTQPINRSTILFASQYKIDEIRIEDTDKDYTYKDTIDKDDEFYHNKMSIEYATDGTFTLSNEGNIVIIENK